MEPRALILQEAARLLAESPSGDVSTRAVCDAAGVTQPVLYRLFGDKDGLLAAVADSVWDEYLSRKRAAEASDDALADLRAGWDAHTAFARENPHAYRLVFGSALTARPAALAEAMRLLTGVLERLAADGRLSMGADEAARVVMAANSGLALGVILRPELHPDADAASALTREAVIRGILADGDAPVVDAAAVAATTLRAHVAASEAFTPAESGLLDEWLGRFQRPSRTG
ncbi:TetR/AcrR family transcriptional regulator [Agromyces endophyticus]|uniref:TetR/AcrR family transcriptional regulator n=1 Tax=Agromyces sp. H17E-10 TaxID=2932244 RepID=UPI001FD433F7|nr:TetR/AcrR family transcriptional regulator [Agromyces sp. H17E-10]UOQ90543.1 TetR/AcrR family transcriptional regulator [Agromyces sp. H17E-10]